LGKVGQMVRNSQKVSRSRRATTRRPGRGTLRTRAKPGRGTHVRRGDVQTGARARLKRLRQGSLLAVAITAMILLVWDAQPISGQSPDSTTNNAADIVPAESIEIVPDAGASLQEATSTIRDLIAGFYSFLPKLAIAAVIFLLAVLAAKLLTLVMHQIFSRWEKSEAAAALARIAIYLLALGAALSVVAGDARALVGSIGLVGLALSWALQTPIESFTGWLLNSFRSYYSVGDRIEVGEVFGDVYKIDVLTTTVWEAGGPGKSVAGAQSTGAMITFPNWEVLRSNIVNYSRDFPYVWDEVTIAIANESQLGYAIQVFENVARRILAERMQEPAREYEQLLQRARLAFDIPDEPRVFISLADAWTNCTVRYLVGVRERRRWASKLIIELNREASLPEHSGKIIPAYPRTEVKLRETWHPQTAPNQ
jgi:small conductance mechanosensitive channel